MTLKRVSSVLLLGALVAVAGCSKETEGSAVTPTVVAGLRYVNLVPDTGGMDFRVVDVVGDAPNTFNATFRTGGQPYGVAIAGMPPHTAVLAGQRQIRVFMNSATDPAVASTVMKDTSITFDAGVNYTVYLWGYARTGQTPSIGVLVTTDNPTDPGAGNFAIRVIHLAPTLGTTFATGTAVDVWVDTLAAAATPVGTPTFTNVNIGEVRAYLTRTVRRAAGAVPALNYRVAVALTGTTTPFFQADVPNGTPPSTTTGLGTIPGDLVDGSGFSVVIAPRSVALSAATNFTTPGLLFPVDRRPPRVAQ